MSGNSLRMVCPWTVICRKLIRLFGVRCLARKVRDMRLMPKIVSCKMSVWTVFLRRKSKFSLRMRIIWINWGRNYPARQSLRWWMIRFLLLTILPGIIITISVGMITMLRSWISYLAINDITVQRETHKNPIKDMLQPERVHRMWKISMAIIRWMRQRNILSTRSLSVQKICRSV